MKQQDFLEECGKSYLQVLDAIGYFRTTVQDLCKRAADKHITPLAGVLGLDVEDLRLLPHAMPDKPSPTGLESAELGWKVKRHEDLYIYFYVAWDRDVEPGATPLSARMCLYLKSREKAAPLATKLDDLCEDPRFKDQVEWEYWADSPCLFFSNAVQESELVRLDQKLDELMGFVIPFLKAAKGIQKYFLP